MTLYVDSSALMKRYLSEQDSEVAERFIAGDQRRATCHITEVEIRRNLARLLKGEDLIGARRQFQSDLNYFAIINIDSVTCGRAASIAEQTQCRSLDALHVAAALLVGKSTTFLTFDIRQAQAARSVGLEVVGA